MGCTCTSSALLLDNAAPFTFRVKVASQHRSVKRHVEVREFTLTTDYNSLQRRFETKALDLRHALSSLGYEILLDDGGFGNNNNYNNNGRGNNNDDNNNNNDGGRNNEESHDWSLNNLAVLCSYNFASLFRSQLCNGNLRMHELAPSRKFLLYLLPFLGFLGIFHLGYARALEGIGQEEDKKDKEVVWEVRGSKRMKVVPDMSKDEFLVVLASLMPSPSSTKGENKVGDVSFSAGIHSLRLLCKDLAMGLMLPEGFPESVTSDYLDYSLWRGLQEIASQISGVLATQSLLYAVGLGKGAIPTIAAINWVLKDGIGYLSKIMLSKYGRHFDVNPKGWRLFADLMENTAFGLEILTPAFPHFFVFIGATAGAGRSAASLIQATTRSCFYAGFAARRNFAEVIAKGEAQGMVSKSIGIMLGIALAYGVGSSTPLALACFGVVTWVHMFFNLKSYQCIQLRTMNPYRAST